MGGERSDIAMSVVVVPPTFSCRIWKVLWWLTLQNVVSSWGLTIYLVRENAGGFLGLSF